MLFFFIDFPLLSYLPLNGCPLWQKKYGFIYTFDFAAWLRWLFHRQRLLLSWQRYCQLFFLTLSEVNRNSSKYLKKTKDHWAQPTRLSTLEYIVWLNAYESQESAFEMLGKWGRFFVVVVGFGVLFPPFDSRAFRKTTVSSGVSRPVGGSSSTYNL